MGRPAKAVYSKKYGCWVSTAIGEARETKAGRSYRALVRAPHLTHPTRDDSAAQAWLHNELANRSRVILGDDVTFEQLTEFYLQESESRLGGETYDRAVEHLERFGNWPGRDDPSRMDVQPCRRIEAEDVERYVSQLVKSGLSESYVSEGLLKTLKSCFNWATKVKPGRYAGLPLGLNPTKGVKGPPVKRRVTRDESPENVHRLIVWAMRRAKGMRGLKRRFARISTVLLLCLRDSGARPKELCSARWDQWKVEPDGWSTFTLEVWKNSKKTGEVRTIALPPHCTRRIAWIKRQPGSHPTHVFVHRRPRGAVEQEYGTPEAGEPWVPDPSKKGNTKSLQKWFYRLRKEAIARGVPIGKTFRLYWNRSMFSTAGQRRGVPLALLAKAMGTSEGELRKHYSDLTKTDVLDVAKAAMGVQ